MPLWSSASIQDTQICYILNILSYYCTDGFHSLLRQYMMIFVF